MSWPRNSPVDYTKHEKQKSKIASTHSNAGSTLMQLRNWSGPRFLLFRKSFPQTSLSSTRQRSGYMRSLDSLTPPDSSPVVTNHVHQRNEPLPVRIMEMPKHATYPVWVPEWQAEREFQLMTF